MAILKKGILGTPKGKIANIVGYERHGKGIIQHIPTRIKAPHRTHNLSIVNIKQFLTNQWNDFPVSIQPDWEQFFDNNGDTFSQYMDYNLNISSFYHARNYDNMWLSPPVDGIATNMSFDLNLDNRILTLSFIPPVIVSSRQSNIRIFVTRILSNYTRTHVILTPLIIGVNEYIFDLKPFWLSNIWYFRIMIQAIATSGTSQKLIADTESIRV